MYDWKWAQIKRCKATEEEARKQQAKSVKTLAALLKELEKLKKQKIEYETKIFELNRVIQGYKDGLKNLEKQDPEASRKEGERIGWWAFLKSTVYGKQNEGTDQQKEQRESERFQRLQNKNFKTAQLKREEASLRSLKVKLEGVNKDIVIMKQKSDAAALTEAIEDSHLCSSCLTETRLFAFQCPRCKIMACATKNQK